MHINAFSLSLRVLDHGIFFFPLLSEQFKLYQCQWYSIPSIPCASCVPVGRVSVLDVVVDRSCFPCPRICRTDKHRVTRLRAAKVVVGQRTFANLQNGGNAAKGMVATCQAPE